ncbi:hypothetical protein BC833DRAFT_588755 [Globomyces pollinis-pini]|nr:hypothetical protein BC833DRAFT_588755 [Globomyces pollinis-pini]
MKLLGVVRNWEYFKKDIIAYSYSIHRCSNIIGLYLTQELRIISRCVCYLKLNRLENYF